MMEKKSPFQIIRRYFITGLLVLLPSAVTIFILVFLFRKIDGILGGLFELWLGVQIPGLGFVALVLIILSVGFLTSFYIGKKTIALMDSFFTRAPLTKTIYSTVKQFQDLLDVQKRIVFTCPVLTEYPRKGLWAIGFLAHERGVELAEKNLHAIFIPTTPNPTSGFLLLAEDGQFTRLDMPIDEAMKIVISAGIILPEKSYTEKNEEHNIAQCSTECSDQDF